MCERHLPAHCPGAHVGRVSVVEGMPWACGLELVVIEERGFLSHQRVDANLSSSDGGGWISGLCVAGSLGL